MPLFDKLSDSRKKTQKLIKIKCDILILEGWCAGCPPISRKYLFSNINTLERKFDNNGKWREYYNRLLINKYSKVFGKFNSVIYIKAPSFKHVLSWRIKQENFSRKLSRKDESSGMTPQEIVNFIQHYEKITKWMSKKMPTLANLVLYVNKDQKILKIRKN